MNHHKVDRYRGSCLSVSNGRGRGVPHNQSGRLFLDGRTTTRPQVGWQCPRGRTPMNSVCHYEVAPHNLGFIYEGTPTISVPVYSYPPFRRGHRTHTIAAGNSCSPFYNRPSTNPYVNCSVSSCLCPPNSSVVTSCPLPSNAGTTWYVRSQTARGEYSSHINSSIKDQIEQLPMARLALQPEKKENVPTLLTMAREEEREDSLSPPSSSDTVSVTSDEGSGGTPDAILPRIIKPRKRRKKDRKPVTSTPQTPPTSQCSSDLNLHSSTALTHYLTNSMHGDEDNSRTVVTLKPYIPICFQHEGQTSPPCFSQCSSPLLFPTPPPSPAASIANSSCSEDESVWPPAATMGVSEKGVLVRSYSAPHPPTSAAPFVSRIRISSTVTHSFNGHREIDLRLFSVEPPQSISVPAPPPPRLRHFSTPCPTRRKIQAIENTSSIPSPPRKYIPQSYWQEMQEIAVRSPAPTEREWVPLNEPNNTKATCIFTVLCYNVLCDKFATRQMYGYCPPWALEWSYRKKGIMEEIRRCSADIITLQEVETDQFFNFFLPELKKENYDGIFSPKSRAKHMSESERKFVDGCAIFWRTNKFTLIEEHLIEFNQLAMANHDGSEDMLNRVMTKDNIGLAALLHSTEHAWGSILPDKSQICQPILVCTAHIHWDPEFCDVKLIQTIMLMSEIRGIVSQIVEDSRSRGGPKMDFNDIHLMLCGDLNSLPESGVIEFLMKGSVSMDHDDFKGLGYKTPLQKIALSKNHNAGLVNTATNSYTHSFRLSATYATDIMTYTNYTYDFKGIIDYIFHSHNSIRTLGVLGPIDQEWFIQNKIVGCPHPHVPSDHFPLLVELELSIPNSTPHPNGLLHR